MKRDKIIVVGIVLCLLTLVMPGAFAESTVPNYQPLPGPLDDPDGPFEGGLDDEWDWIYLGMAGMYGFILGSWVKQGILRNTETIREFLSQLFLYGLFTWDVLMCLGEAFDVIDYDGDNC